MLYNLFENRDFVSVFAVALLAEGVDRNEEAKENIYDGVSSPSSRRAWIEILYLHHGRRNRPVALLAEGVDRNIVVTLSAAVLPRSPSSRRAWIEIHVFSSLCTRLSVALLAEGVDRNLRKGVN